MRSCTECGNILPGEAAEECCPKCLLLLGIREPAPEYSEKPRLEAAGDRISHFKLLEVIGEGAFGTVWMAEQEWPLRRRVALKIIKLGMDTRSVVARFEAERQALAMMDHPNIARVFDGGATRSGRPFFVMELVRGVNLTEFCDARKLKTRERIELFIKVCEAVQHAHQKGVIHRDLKPSNILVTEQDGRPLPKVIDFGIAKATEQRLTDKTYYTHFNQFMGTPAYMSPEQTGLGLDIDTRSDVYSLGVLLYELVTGHTPFDTRKLMTNGVEAMQKAIREIEPLKPSTRLTTLSQGELTALEDCRRESPQQLSKLLRGELDWVILKALDKDRARRYATANGFAAELRRYLNGEVVTAAPPTVAYRFQKAWRRHKLIFTAVAAVAASLLLGLAVSTWLFINESLAKKEVRQNLYASEMNVAFRAWQDGRVVRARALLEKQRPHSGESDLRGFEWRYLWHHSRANELFTLTNATTEWGFALSPDGKTLATCSGRQVVLWDVNTRKLTSILGPAPPGWLFSFAFSPDGRTLASAHYHQREVRFWDIANRKQIGQLNTTVSPIGVAYSPDGKTLVTSGGSIYQPDSVAEVVIWDADSKHEIRRLLGATSWVYQATFSPDGQTLAASGGDGAITLWKVPTGEMIHRLRGHNGFVEPATFSLDGELLASGDQHGHVWLWHWRTRRVETVFRAHNLPVYSIAFSPDQQRLITASRDHTARMWDRKTGHEIARFAGHAGGVTGAKLLPDGQTMITASQDGNIKFWDIRNRLHDSVLGTHTGSDVHITFTSSGRFLACVERDKKQITFYETATGVNVRNFSGQGVSASQDGKFLTLVHDSKLIFLDPVTLTGIRSMDAGAPIGSSVFSPNGNLIAIRRRDSGSNNIVIIDVEQQSEIKVFQTQGEEWAPLLFAPNGTLLLTGGETASTLSMWDPGSQRKVAYYKGIEGFESGNIAALALSPDGKTIAASGKADFVLVWAIDRPSHPTVLNTGAGYAQSLAFSPDGKTLAIGSIDGTIRLWNVAARQEVAALVGHSSSYINSVAFAPDGRALASVSLDKTLRLWRAPSFKEISNIETDPIRSSEP